MRKFLLAIFGVLITATLGIGRVEAAGSHHHHRHHHHYASRYAHHTHTAHSRRQHFAHRHHRHDAAIGLRAQAFTAPVGGGGGAAREALRWVGRGNPTGSHRAWCGDFVQFALRRSGHRAISSGIARDAVRAGRAIGGPRIGAIMSMRGHTGFVIGVLPGGRVRLVSGNFSHRVGIGTYSTRGARFAMPT